MRIRYFDHAATTNVKEEVVKEMLPYFSIEYGNASSLYSLGRTSKKAIEEARKRVAKALHAKPKEIYFTSCGSEADNLALKGIAYQYKNKGKHIITSKIEHPAILETCKTLEKQGYEITYLNVDENGFISLSELEFSIREDTILISIMFANNEIGTIQPIEQIGQIAKKHNVLFHTDSVQAVGNVKIDVEAMNIDLLSMSAHKFYGPKGVGALYVREGVEFERIQDGGHQEKNKRAGTENVAGIVGLGKAIELKEKRLPGNTNISFEGIHGEELLLKLDEKGICASAGSACSSGTPSPSHVLLAIGLKPELAYGSLRITLGEENTKEDIDFLIEQLAEIIPKLRK